MKEKYVSIIIPVYNCEKFLERCIESVIYQSYELTEILLVDDGSTDRSGIICDMYAHKDKRIKVFHISNGGVSNARNIGIKNAEGEYIQFVDSDDTIKYDMTESLVKSIESTNTDMVVCGYDRITKYIKRRDKFWDKPGAYDSKEYLVRTLQDPTGYYYGAIWNKLYKKSVIINNKVLFDNHLTLGEDFVFNIEYLRYAVGVQAMHKRAYIYNYTNVGSLSRYKKRTIDVYKKEFENRRLIFNKYKQAFLEFNIYEDFEKQIYDYWKNYYISNMYELKHGFFNFSESDKSKWEEIINKNSEINKCVTNISRLENCFLTIKISYHRLFGKVKEPIKWLVYKVKVGGKA